MQHSLHYLNWSVCASLLIRLCLYKTQASSLGLVITFVNNFQFYVSVFCKLVYSNKLNLNEVTHFIILVLSFI